MFLEVEGLLVGAGFLVVEGLLGGDLLLLKNLPIMNTKHLDNFEL